LAELDDEGLALRKMKQAICGGCGHLDDRDGEHALGLRASVEVGAASEESASEAEASEDCESRGAPPDSAASDESSAAKESVGG